MEQSIPQKREASVDNTEHVKHYSTRSTTQSSSSTKKVISRLKPLPYTKQDLYNEIKPPPKHHITAIISKGKEELIDFYATEDHPFNRRGFKYKACSPNPNFASLMYGTTDLPPYNVRFSYFDRSQGSFLDESLRKMTFDQGWRSCRTNFGIREGVYFFEFKIVRANEDNFPGHIRIGLGRKEASIEAPVGFDGYGYGLRDKTGQKVHLSRPVDFMKGGFSSGDVIGMLVELPSLDVQRKISEMQIQANIKSNPLLDETARETLKSGDIKIDHNTDIIRDQIPIRYKNQLFFEQFEYTLTTPIEHLLNPVTVFGERAIPDKDKFKPAVLPESKVTVYKNGQLVGVAFEELYAYLPPNSEASQNPIIANQKKNKKGADQNSEIVVVPDDGTLGYYPMASSFKNGCVEINPGPDFYKLPAELKAKIDQGQIHPLSDRYGEKVVEDVVYDIVDEIESQFLDTLEG